jgi:hypothetical protein
LPGQVTVGQSFIVEVRATGPAGTTWTFPTETGDERVELRAVSETKGSLPSSTQRYRAVAYALDEVGIPAIAVAYTLPTGQHGEVRTEVVPVKLASGLPKDPAQQTPADIRPPVSLPLGVPFWIAVALVLTAVASGVWWLVRRRRKALAPAVPVPLVAPDVEALSALDRLAATDLLPRHEFRAFYIELAEIAKRYLERRLEAPILEMTSSETVGFLRDHVVGREHVSTIRELVSSADVVKFARGGAESAVAERQLAAVRGVVTVVEGRLCPPVGPPEKAA